MPLPLDRMTITGLGVAALGWVVLAGDAALGMLPAANEPLLPALARSDIFTVAEATVLSGFALATLGTLRTGFGALSAFFDTVLARAGSPRPQPPARRDAHERAGPEPAIEPAIEPALEVVPPAHHSARPRNYSILPNGAVEVDTLLGTRVFASLDEARDYIR